MQINKLGKFKKMSKEGIIYSAIFILYIAVLVLIFIYSIKFLNDALQVSLSTPQEDMAAKYGQLDLENYSLLVDRLGLEKPLKTAPVTAASETPLLDASIPGLDTSTTATNTTSSLPTASTTTSPEIVTSSAVIIPSPDQVIVPGTVLTKPKILITNSTPTIGLATNLKNKLLAAGYEVAKTNNSQSAQANTIIMIKPSFQNSLDVVEIQKIVNSNYLSTTQDLAESAAYDLEIIIGNK